MIDAEDGGDKKTCNEFRLLNPDASSKASRTMTGECRARDPSFISRE